MLGTLSFTVAPTRFFPRSFSTVNEPAGTASGMISVTTGCICSRVPRVTESVTSVPGLFSNIETMPLSSIE